MATLTPLSKVPSDKPTAMPAARRIHLAGDLQEALTPLLFDRVTPRGSERKVIVGSAGETQFKTYLLIEAARRPDVGVMLEGFGVPYCSLYQGQSADDFARHAPYLAQIEKGSAAAQWAIAEGWDGGWGVWLRSAQPLEGLRRHFRKFTQLYNPEEERWYIFRFYAPETMRRIVPALPPTEFAALTQGIAAIIVPGTSDQIAVVI